MITTTNVMWTCLPNGIVTPGASPLTLKLSVVATPQVVSSGGDTIAGTVFQNWPAFIRAVAASSGWIVAFDNATASATATMTKHIDPTPDFNVDGSLLWQAIFPPTTPVTTTQTAQTATADYKIHSFDAGAIAAAVRAAHRYVVASHARHGKLVLTGSDPYSALLAQRKQAKRLLPKMATALRGHTGGAAHKVLREAYQAETGELGIGYELMRHALFYDHDKHRARQRRERLQRSAVRPMDGTTTPVDSDFNSIIGHLGGQPLLLRKLGLVVDLEFAPPPAVATYITGLKGAVTPPNAWKIYMSMPPAATFAPNLPGIDPSPLQYVVPSTYADVTSVVFRTTVLGAPSATGGGSINSGFLPLGDGAQYSVYTEDTEGSPIKLDIASQTTSAGTDTAAPVPAFRTSGIALSQTARDASLETAFAKQAQLTKSYWLNAGNGANELLNAEDVVRGYAVDIQVTNAAGVTTPFQSVHLRDSRLYFPGLSSVAGAPTGTPTSFVVSDEGYTKAAAANAPDDGDELDLHSALFGWEGWSLAVQRPGRSITAATPEGDTVQTETPLQPVNAPVANFPTGQFTVRAKAGSLPRLRFGSTYTLRARVIDLAGNDTSVGNAGASANMIPSASVTYLRYEPVPNPVVLLQAPLTEGEHVENLVIRSNPWGPVAQNAAQYAAAAAASTTLAPMNPYQATSARWVAPPKGSWSQAEAMGAFDPSYFNVISAAVAADIKSGAVAAGKSYSNATFLATKNLLFQCSQKEAGLFTHTQVWDTSNPSATSPSATNPVQIITPPTAQNLPPPTDPGQPMGTGQYNILLNNGAPVYVPYLPDVNAMGIVLQQLDDGGNPVPGTTGRRSYAPRPGTSWPEIDMPQFVLEDGGLGGALPSLAGSTSNPAGLDGSSPASNTPIAFSLAPGQQFSFSYGSIVADITKMASSDVDPSGAIDTIPTYAPYRPIALVHAVQQPKPPGVPQVAIAPRNAGDTNITITGSIAVDGLTTNSLDFTAWWAEPVDAELGTNVIEAVDQTHRRITVKEGRIQTWTLATTDTQVSFPAGSTTTPPLLEHFGDTKTRLLTFQATATSRFREYFPASLQSDATQFQNSAPAGTFTEGQLASSGVRIPSTARPIAPKILYVVPTYAWAAPTTKTTLAGTTTTSVRTGRGLRVFVDRPWYTTGDNEQLAVVVNAQGTAVPAIADLVSQWGRDPIWNPQSDQLAPLDQNQIVGGVLVPAVPLAENPSQPVTVLGFNPSAYDPVRKLWYFDIEFAASVVEAPFVRLALARFQVSSLGCPAFPNGASGDLRMSNVVLADMIKLSADRTGTYVYSPKDGSVNVTLAGHVYSSEAWSPASGTLAVNTRNDAAGYGRQVCVQVMEATVANPGEFDWYPVGNVLELDAYQLAGAAGNSTALSFIGSVPKPSGLVSGAKHQLLITEHEVFFTDVEAAFPGDSQVLNFPGLLQMAPPPPPPARPPLAENTTSRIVFSDTLALPY